MDYLTVALTAVGLAMDCLAVSLSCGIVMPDFTRKDAFRLGIAFGGFQGGMVFLGWAVGRSFAGYIEDFDHWIAFGLLLFVGLKMIHEGLENKQECAHLDIRSAKVLVILSIVTSIDALAIGISYSILDSGEAVPLIDAIVLPALIIGLVSFCLAAAGGVFGSRLGERFGKRMEIVGGIILILLGVKILAEHTVLA